VIGVYGEIVKRLPFGTFTDKNISIAGGNCNHRAHVEKCLDFLLRHPEEGRQVFTHRAPLEDWSDAYESFVEKTDGMIKCLLIPATSPIHEKIPARGGVETGAS